MDLDNPIKTIVHYLLIGGMDGLNYWDEFLMMSALVCMIIYWIGPMVSFLMMSALVCMIIYWTGPMVSYDLML